MSDQLDAEWLDQFNTTELVEMCKFNEIPGFNGIPTFTSAGATKGYPREVLKNCLLTLNPPPIEPPLYRERQRLADFVGRHWEEQFRCQAIHTQCPECLIGKFDERDKHDKKKFTRCSDLQILGCWLANEDNIL